MFRPRTSARRGSYAIMLALFLSVALGFSAFAVDIGYARLTQVQLQGSLEAAAHAAAMELDGTDDGLEQALNVASALAAVNSAGGNPVLLVGYDVNFGSWDDDSDSFVLTDIPTDVDAVQVETLVDMPTLVAEVAFGRSVEQVGAQAIAFARGGGAGEVECFLPIALPSCLIDSEYGMAGVQSVDLDMAAAGIDRIGWARPETVPDAAWAADQAGDCEADGSVHIGDTMELEEAPMSSALTSIAGLMSGTGTSWNAAAFGSLPPQDADSGVDSADYGATVEGPVLLFDDPDYCAGGGGWDHSAMVTGFAWASIYDVVTDGPEADRTVKVRIDTSSVHELGTVGAGPDYGVTAPGSATFVQ